MSWLVGYVIASMVGALFVVRIFDYVTSGLTHGAVQAARAGLFVGTWTAITASSGMRNFTLRVRKLRQGSRNVGSLLSALPQGKRR